MASSRLLHLRDGHQQTEPHLSTFNPMQSIYIIVELVHVLARVKQDCPQYHVSGYRGSYQIDLSNLLHWKKDRNHELRWQSSSLGSDFDFTAETFSCSSITSISTSASHGQI